MFRWGVSICSIQMRLPFCLTCSTAFVIWGETPLLAAESSTQTPEKSSGGFVVAFAFGVRAARGVGAGRLRGARRRSDEKCRGERERAPHPRTRSRTALSARRRNWPV